MKIVLAAILLAASFGVGATKNPPNPCGNHGNNCQPGDPSGNSSSDSSSSAGAVGVGVGVGTGGDGGNATATASGGAGGSGGNGYGGNAVGLGGSGGDSYSGVKDSGNSENFNANTAKGGNAHQGQSQGQSLNSANLLKMTSENTANLKNHVNASSANDNRSAASGNTTVVGGDSTLVERNAPPVFLGNLSATMSCSGGFNAGASDRNGSGAFGFTWISGDCRSVVIGREFVGIGMPDVACRVWKTTKGYKRAVKADPSLADVDCTIKPEPAAVVVPAPPVSFPLTDRKPRG